MAVAPQPEAQRAWPPAFAPLALVGAFGAAVVGGLLVGVTATIAGASPKHLPPVVNLAATFIQDIAFVLSAIFFAARVARPRPAQFGLRAPRIWRAALATVLGYGALLGFTLAWEGALKIHDKEHLVDQLGANMSAVALIAVLLLTCVIAPVCEELLFRGFFFTALRNWHGVWPAAAITGIVFGAIHAGSAPVGYLVPLAFFGFVLCIVYWQTGSLYPCIALHALNNAIAVGAGEHWLVWQVALLAAASLATIALSLRAVAQLAPAV